MAKKKMMKLHIFPSVFNKNREGEENLNSWQWNSCTNAKTLSFRSNAAVSGGDAMFKTVNSVYLDPSDGVETPESWFTNSTSESASFSAESDDEQIIITGVRSDRLFFDRSGTSSSIAKPEPPPENQENVKKQREEEKDAGEVGPPFEESVVVSMDSDDPYLDFKKSMAEMVESSGINDWDSLQELLGWYLKMNSKMNHGVIVRAFMDLLVGLISPPSCSSSCCSSSSSANAVRTSYSSAVSCLSSPANSPLSSLVGRSHGG
ncbi:unnamed protein product [Cuscuta epithymum]|uniref:Transcription repressor n=1 Tax=Cuscuta epithymum TaxID=186058 RepID=A0AAV0DXY3_9ASTE|nr:unnamed protein product [Cuscuta epithymum]